MRHRASSLIHMYGLNYVADHTNGKLYEFSPDIFSDDGTAIIKQRDTAVIHGGLFGVPGQKLYFDEVEFIIVSGNKDVAGLGAGPQPVYLENTYTSKLYPVDVTDSLEISVVLTSASLDAIPSSYVDTSFAMRDSTYVQTRWFYEDGPYDSEVDATFSMQGSTYVQTRWFYEDGPYDGEVDTTFTMLDSTYINKLVEANAPDEGLDISLAIDASCSMGAV